MHQAQENSIKCQLVPIHSLERGHPLRKLFWLFYNHPENNIYMYWATRSEKEFDEIFDHYIAKNSKEVFIYTENDHPLGTCRIIQGEGPYKHVMTCASTTIDPTQKRKGTGTRLKQTVRAYVKQKYPETLRHELTYEKDNPASRRLNNQPNYYEKCQYKTEGVYTDWWPTMPGNYENMENNPYQEWLDAHQGDNRGAEHFWYTSEVFAGDFPENISNYTKSQVPPLDILRVFSCANLEAESSYYFRLAENEDIEQLLALYKNSQCIWDDAYTSQSKLKTILEQVIAEQQLYVLVATDIQQLVASCKAFKDPVIRHSVALENIALEREFQHSSIAQHLFSKITGQLLKHDPTVKRIELAVVANDKQLVEGLEASGFEYCGIERGKYFDQKKQTFFDQLMFDCKLFNLDDALNCCQKRLAAQNHLQKIKGKNPFNVQLSPVFLEELADKLKALIKLRNEGKISFEQENIVYRLVRTVSTQDLLRIEERLDQLKTISSTFSEWIQKTPAIDEVKKMCGSSLSEKAQNLLSSYSEKIKFFQHAQYSNLMIEDKAADLTLSNK